MTLNSHAVCNKSPRMAPPPRNGVQAPVTCSACQQPCLLVTSILMTESSLTTSSPRSPMFERFYPPKLYCWSRNMGSMLASVIPDSELSFWAGSPKNKHFQFCETWVKLSTIVGFKLFCTTLWSTNALFPLANSMSPLVLRNLWFTYIFSGTGWWRVCFESSRSGFKFDQLCM